MINRIGSLGGHRYRLHFEGRAPLTPGHQFQFRHLMRDVVGAHNRYSKDIMIQRCEFNALAGMGIVSQFTENILYKDVRVVPPTATLRTCPAWADVFQFSGCRGQILVQNCIFSGTQDDAINVHGTFLPIVKQTATDQLQVRFAHKQTYGFQPFRLGDEVAVIEGPTLRERSKNPRRKVKVAKPIDAYEWLLTLDGPAPHFEAEDVLENITWNPDLTVRDCHVDMDSCWGFLISTRGKVLIEGNTFKRCRMPGVLIGADSSSWFESSPVRDVQISNNSFIGCGIEIDPRVHHGNTPVHENIRITRNTFSEGAGIKGHHASGLVISQNRSEDGPLSIKLDPESTDAVVTDNK